MNPPALLRRGLWLEYATLGWNVVGCVVLLLAAIAAGSVALAGFGVDSVIEIVASSVVVWQLKGTVGDGRTRITLRAVSVGFGLLALYIAAQATYVLTSSIHPGRSIAGMLWLALTVAVMLALAAGKRSVGLELGNRVLQSEARVTVVDGLLAAAVLAGIALNAVWGWWWADPVSALAIMFYAVREARHAWKEAGGTA